MTPIEIQTLFVLCIIAAFGFVLLLKAIDQLFKVLERCEYIQVWRPE